MPSAMTRTNEQPIEIFSQSFDLQGHLLDFCPPFLSVYQKRSVQVVQRIVKLVLLFENGKFVRFVLLVKFSTVVKNNQWKFCGVL